MRSILNYNLSQERLYRPEKTVRKDRTQKEAYDWIPRTRQQRREAVRETLHAVGLDDLPQIIGSLGLKI